MRELETEKTTSWVIEIELTEDAKKDEELKSGSRV